MKRWSYWILQVPLLAAPLAGPARATLLEPFSGYVDVAAIQEDVNGQAQESLRQDYNIGFLHRIVPYVDLRLAYRYYDIDQNFTDLALGSYRKEKQPSGELRWNHPLFLASGSVFRREVETAARLPIITNSSQFVLKSKDLRYPLVEFRYDQQHSYYTDVFVSRDILTKRFQAAASYDPGVHHLRYTYSRDLADNVISDLESKSRRHLFRWSGTNRFLQAGRLQLGGNYTFGQTTQFAEVRNGGPILRILPVLRGLYALDDTPEIGALEARNGLVDGNTSAPVIPLIDMGGTSNDHNLGADLGGTRYVGGLYVYTDRPSGTDVNWSVWGSSDNVTWDLVATSPQRFFNSALNRYELTLPVAAAHRYVKVVNSGLNNIAQVYVTELVVLEQVTDKTEEELQFVSHQADGRMGYRFNEYWQGTLDASLQVEENPGRSGDRTRSSVGARANYVPSKSVAHNLRWEVSRQDNEGFENLTENALAYALMVDPMETLRGSFSLSDRFNWLDRARSTHLLSAAGELNADLFADLLASVGATASRSEDFIGGRKYRVWNVRSRLEAALTRSLDLILDGLYQETLEIVADDLGTRVTVGVGIDWRLTRDLYFRGSFNRTRDRTDRLNIDSLLSWNILPSLRVSIQHYEIASDTKTTTLRQGVNLNWEINSRSNVYLRLAKVDLSGGGGTRTTSFQQGFRIGF